MTMNYGLQGRVILVTGGASGIGKAIATAAAQGGAHVAIVDAAGDRAQAVAAELRAHGIKTVAETLDVRDAAACEAVVARVEAALGPIDGLVTAAGVSQPSPAATMSAEIWSRTIDINLTGLFQTAQAVGRRMVARGRGAIVNIASVDAFNGHAGRSHYAASKHGVVGLTRSLAIEWGRLGVRVNAIAPGIVDTPLLRANIPTDSLQAGMVDRTPLGRLAKAEELAGPALFLLSDGASYVNGSTLTVDGGTTAGTFTRWNGADLQSKVLLEQGVYAAPTQN
ncbi:MAG: SDR family NAD(P)-dependent oxidoreductase [Burkholderiales bacterium]